MYVHMLLTTYEECIQNNGIFDQYESLTVYFDPEEYYVSLHVANPTRKAEKFEHCTKDGHPVEIYRYEYEDILIKYNGELIYQ
jgi:hypothetical protein